MTLDIVGNCDGGYCAQRDPVSSSFGSLDPGWLLAIVLSLQGRGLHDLVVLRQSDAMVDWELRDDGTLEVHDVIASRLPSLETLLREAPPHERVELFFCPDRLAPEATPIPLPEEGLWMVRPDPGLGDIALAVPRLASH
ncbi:MAG: hypothetical protein AAGA56_22305 [Myxococcota bacterium]